MKQLLRIALLLVIPRVRVSVCTKLKPECCLPMAVRGRSRLGGGNALLLVFIHRGSQLLGAKEACRVTDFTRYPTKKHSTLDSHAYTINNYINDAGGSLPDATISYDMIRALQFTGRYTNKHPFLPRVHLLTYVMDADARHIICPRRPSNRDTSGIASIPPTPDNLTHLTNQGNSFRDPSRSNLGHSNQHLRRQQSSRRAMPPPPRRSPPSTSSSSAAAVAPLVGRARRRSHHP